MSIRIIRIGILMLIVVLSSYYLYMEYKVKSSLDSSFMSEILYDDVEPDKAIDKIESITVFSFEDGKTYRLTGDEVKILLNEYKRMKIKRRGLFSEGMKEHYAISFPDTGKTKFFTMFVSNENEVKFSFNRDLF